MSTTVEYGADVKATAQFDRLFESLPEVMRAEFALLTDGADPYGTWADIGFTCAEVLWLAAGELAPDYRRGCEGDVTWEDLLRVEYDPEYGEHVGPDDDVLAYTNDHAPVLWLVHAYGADQDSAAADARDALAIAHEMRELCERYGWEY
jgi:hypothetical protein